MAISGYHPLSLTDLTIALDNWLNTFNLTSY